MTDDRGQRTDKKKDAFFFRPLSSAVCFLIRIYQYSLAYLLGGQCRFAPSCSAYAIEAIEIYGPLKGARLAAARICRCHPWGGHGLDPVQRTDDGKQRTEKSYP
jgi:uncharacterized protein